MSDLGVILAILFIAHFVYTGSIALAGYLLGVDIEEVAIGHGPAMYRKGIFRVSVLPFGAYVKLNNVSIDDERLDQGELSVDEEKRCDVESNACRLPYNKLSRWRRFLIMSSGMLVSFGISFSIFRDIEQTIDVMVLSLSSLYAIICGPFSDAYVLYDSAWNFVLAHPMHIGVAHVLLIFVGINILPVPLTSCGMMLFEIVNPKRKHHGVTIVQEVLSWCVLLVEFLVMISLIAYMFT